MTEASHLLLMCCSFDCASWSAKQRMCIHAAHAKGAGAHSCCIVEATATSCEHASASLQRDAGCQTSRLAPVLQRNTDGHIISKLCICSR